MDIWTLEFHICIYLKIFIFIKLTMNNFEKYENNYSGTGNYQLQIEFPLNLSKVAYFFIYLYLIMYSS